MSRRLPVESASSLELLLDTICNMFGGVLLISLLVALLLNTTSKEVDKEIASPESQAELLAAEIEREQVERELKELQESVQKQKTAAETLMAPELVEEAQRYLQATQEHAELVGRKTSKIGEASTAQLRINDLNRETADRKAQLEETRLENAQLDKEVKTTVVQRSQKATIPKLREANTQQQVFFVVNRRLYGPWTVGQFRRFNEMDFILPDRKQGVLRVQPGGGIPIPATSEDDSALEEKLANVDASQEHATVFVWPDSYSEFAVVRQALVRENIKLELIPLPEGEEVPTGGTPDLSPSQVQ